MRAGEIMGRRREKKEGQRGEVGVSLEFAETSRWRVQLQECTG